tara:strand:+ start:680 stop:1024 length:345 start_codon:yes stop_codon:yes gene_type:complete
MDKKKDGCTAAPDFNFAEVCNNHDNDYYWGGSNVNRKKADKKLRDGIVEKNPDSKFYFLISRLYYIAVRIFGWTRYRYNQKDSYRERNGLFIGFVVPTVTILGVIWFSIGRLLF